MKKIALAIFLISIKCLALKVEIPLENKLDSEVSYEIQPKANIEFETQKGVIPHNSNKIVLIDVKDVPDEIFSVKYEFQNKELGTESRTTHSFKRFSIGATVKKVFDIKSQSI